MFSAPVGFTKWVFDMPNALAFLFIKSVKSFTFPETSSAKIKAAALLELETVIWSSSLIVYVSPAYNFVLLNSGKVDMR